MSPRLPSRLVTPIVLLGAIGSAAVAQSHAKDATRAFPGAEGFGQYARGGRGGRVIQVTSLDDHGPGSLRSAVSARGPRTVVFEVSGIIDLKRDIRIQHGELTLAGQTAPGDGITLRGRSLVVEADDVILRYLRVRPGDGAGVELDAISVARGKNIILDHCSTSWATDETLSVAPSRLAEPRSIDNVTVQWSIISESLNASVHSKGKHGYGTLLRGDGGARYSLHHNLWAHHKARMPRPGNYRSREADPVGPVFDIRNNVFYDWGGSSSGYNADTDSVARYNFVGNYYLEGPSSRGPIAFDESNPNASLYFAGNWMNGSPVENAMSVVRMPEGGVLAAREHAHESGVTETADVAFRQVLKHAGASRVRDAVDRRIVAEVLEGSGKIIDDVREVGGWPEHVSRPAPADADRDGMPDDWEKNEGLDPNDPSDGPRDPDGDGYTNLEHYLNGLARRDSSNDQR